MSGPQLRLSLQLPPQRLQLKRQLKKLQLEGCKISCKDEPWGEAHNEKYKLSIDPEKLYAGTPETPFLIHDEEKEIFWPLVKNETQEQKEPITVECPMEDCAEVMEVACEKFLGAVSEQCESPPWKALIREKCQLADGKTVLFFTSEPEPTVPPPEGPNVLVPIVIALCILFLLILVAIFLAHRFGLISRLRGR